MPITKEEFDNAYLMDPREAAAFHLRLARERPDFLRPFAPRWWWWRRCHVDVLIVTDGSLDFGTGGFGLSQFLTTFNTLEAETWIDYRVTTAHRTSGPQSNNPVVVAHHDGFDFTDVDLNDFDQIWLFGFQTGGAIGAGEVGALEDFMNNGGGVFATGDHGSIGSAMCGSIPRVQDMRHWADFDGGQVSMTGARRNDTNQPEAGSTMSHYFDNQSDATPQTIAVRTFGAGNPHPLLSISPALDPSGIINVMPDHPHEGECKQETTFEVDGVAVPTQVIATSFVGGGSTTNGPGLSGKTPTEPHCFPSIAVWDGWKAKAGRIVVDSTWHHFVNINLNGAGSGSVFGDIPGLEPGLDNADWVAVRQYYMNIARWMSRRRIWWCWWRRLAFELVFESQLVEAATEFGIQGLEETRLSELESVGSMAEEVLSSRFNPGYARSLLLEMVEVGVSPGLADQLDEWAPATDRDDAPSGRPWLNLDRLLHIAVGAGFLAIRTYRGDDGQPDEEDLESFEGRFNEGLALGLSRGLEVLRDTVSGSFDRLG